MCLSPCSFLQRAALVLGALLVLIPSLAAGSHPRCRLERVGPAAPGSEQLQVLASVVDLEGNLDPRPATAFRLGMDGKSLGRETPALTSLAKSGLDTYIVVAVEVSALYAPAIEPIKEALREFTESMESPHIKIKLVLFGNELEEKGGFRTPGSLSSDIDDINPDDEGEIQLVNAIRSGLRALNALKKSEKPEKKGLSRTLIVVLSDGINSLMDRKGFKQLGEDLRKSEVSLFPIAFSPRNDRGPLLNLGELAKRSAGTFRWAEKADDLKDRFASLSKELRGVQVLTFAGKVDVACLPASTFKLLCGDLPSTHFTLAGQRSEGCEGSSWWKWLLGILGGIVGLWAVAQGAVYLLNRRGPGKVPKGVAPGPFPPPPSAGTPPRQASAGWPVPGGYPPGAQQKGPVLPASAVANLVMIGGRLGGQRVSVPFKLVIGKAVAGPGTLLIVDDPSLGPTHCEIQRDLGGYVLSDLGTPGGCFINDRRVAGMTRLTDGDLVRLGAGTQFKFRID